MARARVRFDEACEAFYGALAEPERWPAALQLLSDAAGSRGVSIIPVGLPQGSTITCPSLSDYIADFISGGWESKNSRMMRGLQLTRAGLRGLITDTDMFTPEELRRDPFFNEFIVPHRMGATAGMVLAQAPGELVLPISFERTAAQGFFQPHEVAEMNHYMALIRPAAAMALELGLFRAKVSADAIASAGQAAILLSPSGNVLHVSPGADKLLGDALTVRGRKLRSWHDPTDALLSAAVLRSLQQALAIDRIGPELLLPRRQPGPPLRLQVVPLVRSVQDVFALARAIVVVRDPVYGVSGQPAEIALATFGLTNAETRLALLVADGLSLHQAAAVEGITRETARSRLKAIMAKTRTHRQTELALLVARWRGLR